MKYRFIHLMINSYVRFSLKNVIGDNEGHKIFIIKDNTYTDIEGNKVSSDELDMHLQKAEVVFAHFLNGKIARLLNQLSDSKKIVWFSWGGDIYSLGKFRKGFLQPKTKRLFYKIGLTDFKIFKNILTHLLGPLVDLFPPNKTVLQAINKVDIIVPVVLADYKNLKRNYMVEAEAFQVNYASKIFKAEPSFDPSQKKTHFLLGNSASFTNNHLEAVDLLSQFNLGDSKVFIPMSYGKNAYADYVKNYAEDKLGTHARVLTERLPYDEYGQLYAKCRSVLMNHNRQQAMGNIFLAFWFENTLYLNSNADHYRDLTDKGFKILDIKNFHPDLQLTLEERKRNKELLYEWYGLPLQQKKFNQLLERLT